MRLIDVDKLLKDIHDSGNTYEAWIYECILNQQVIDQEKEIEKVKADLCKILDSYCSPIHFIDTTEMDVDKFKEAMSKAQLQAIPRENKFDKFCQLYEDWLEGKKLGVQDVDRRDIITKYVYPSYISIDDVNRLIAIVKKGE